MIKRMELPPHIQPNGNVIRLTADQLQAHLDRITEGLLEWSAEHPNGNYSQSFLRSGRLDDLGYELQDLAKLKFGLGHNPQLVNGTEAIPARYMVTLQGGDFGLETGLIQPGESLSIFRGDLCPRVAADEEPTPPDIYGQYVWRFGDATKDAALSGIAIALANGGRLVSQPYELRANERPAV
jgi:hypothetical protein